MLRGPGYVGASGQRRTALLSAAATGPLVSFSRAGNLAATYQSTGITRYAAHNLIYPSSPANAGMMGLARGTQITGLPGPFGALNATMLTEDTQNGVHGWYSGTPTTFVLAPHTLSGSFKPGTVTLIQLSLDGAGGTATWANGQSFAIFDLTTGTLLSRLNCTTTITPQPGGFYRCSITATPTAAGTGRFLAAHHNGSTSGYAGVITNTSTTADLQLEVSPEQGAFVPTTTAPVYSTPRYTRSTLISQNLVRNPRAEGAANPSTPPTNWTLTVPGSGISATVVGNGTDPETGWPYLDVTYAGTASATIAPTNGFIAFDTVTGIPASTGQTWALSCVLRLVAGTWAGTLALDVCERDSGGGLLRANTTAVTPTATTQRLSTVMTLAAGAGTTYVQPLTRWGVNSGTVVAFTIRVMVPQLQPGAVVGPVSLPPVGQPGPSVLYTGGASGPRLLIEESRTSSVVNPRFEGATFHTGTPAILQPVIDGSGVVTGFTILQAGDGYTVAPTIGVVGAPGTGFAGTVTISGGVVTGVTITNGGTGYVNPGSGIRGGSLPSSYFWGGTAQAGAYWSQSIVGVDTRNGIPRLKVRYAAQGAVSGCELAWSNQLAATQGQVVSQSSFVEVVAGSLAGISGSGHSLYEVPSSASLGISFLPTLAAAPNTFQRILNPNRTISQAASTAVAGRWSVSGTTYDVTLGYGCPQLELGAFASSPILPPPGSPAVTTRANDVATVSLGSWFKQAGTVTNLSTRSSDPTHIDWSKTFGTPTSGVLAPDGTTTAALFVPDTSLNPHHLNPPGINYTAGTAYVDSIFAKAAGYRYLHTRYSFSTFPNNSRAAVFDLQTGIVVAADPGVTATILAAPNGFYRCSLGAVASASALATSLWAANATLNGGGTSQEAYAGDGVSGIAFFGHMAEAGALTPGPYIPTIASAVSKIATGPGTIVVKGMMPQTTGQNFPRMFELSDGTSSNALFLHLNNSPKPKFQIQIAGVNVAAVELPDSVVAGTPYKLALAWGPGDQALVLNGGTPGTATALLPPGLITVTLGDRPGGDRTNNGEFEGVDYYPARLSNAQLQALTV